ncbi:Phox homologous domain-containing protein [Lipomyces arxii]|uniref:Phox homologous domain-containing protein n=1 Tax=Lipomyces arxii TaxID=56418 RepID=UPI0034CF290D
MDVISLPTSGIGIDKTVTDSTTSRLKDVFTFKTNGTPLISSWMNSFSRSSSHSATAADTHASSVFSSESDDVHSLMSPVPPGIVVGSPGDPHDLTPVDPVPITLVDHSMDDNSDNGKMWAKSAWVGDYSIVAGTGKAGAYVTWMCMIETDEGRTIKFRKRYSEFCKLQSALTQEFPRLRGAIPGLPPKSIISKFRPAFLDERRRGLEYFLACIVLNSVFSNSDVVKEFIASSTNSN